MIRNVIFDIGNVLARFRWKDYIEERFPEDMWQKIADATVRGPYWDEVDRGVLPIAEIAKKCAALVPGYERQIEAFFAEREKLVEEYAYSASLVRSLRAAGYHVYLLSNYAGDLFDYARAHFKFIPLAEGGVISYEIHKIKPEREIYEELLRRYDLVPEECVFVDDLKRNLCGAATFGIHTVLFTGLEDALGKLKELGVTPLQAMIFDVDGTLWDTTEAAAKIWSDVAAKYPEVKDDVTAEKLKNLYGLPLEDIAEKLFVSVPKETAIRVMEECVKVQCPILAKGGVSLIGDVAGAFAKLKEKYRIFIVSNCRSGYIEAMLAAHDLGGLVDDFTCPGDTGLLKADNIRLICERNHLPLSAALYVGDTLPDEVAAHAAGVPFAFAEYGFGRCENPDYRIADIMELTELF
ncbi:MAG: HAD-IA family hydrolase [Lachnospiraceae bacterium]|nr:HAD-IA family hydrolase [Lachnospiraceae bacterium]